MENEEQTDWDGKIGFAVSTAAFFPRPLEEIFAILQQQPWDGIELMPQAPNECRPAFADELLRRAGDRFSFCAIHFPSILQPFLYNPYPSAQRFAQTLCQDLADLGGRLACDVIVVHAPKGRMSTGRFLEVTRSNLAYLCDCSAQHGIKVGLENLTSSPLARTSSALKSFAASLNRPNLGYVLDVTHAHETGQSPVRDFVEQLPNLVHVHASDYSPEQGQHQVPGAGVVDWPALAGALHKAGFDGSICLELLPETLGKHPATTLCRTAAFLQPLLTSR
ncbi:MAG: sugar phosphate isomerase/epimerase family protein [bacterium]